MYIIAVQDGLLFFVGWLSPLFKFLKKWLHDLLRLKPPSLFMLFGCISISMASLMRRSLYLVFVERSLVSSNLMMWSRLKLCSATDTLH